MSDRFLIAIMLFALRLEGQTLCFHPGDDTSAVAGLLEINGFRPDQIEAWRAKEPDWSAVCGVFPHSLWQEKRAGLPPMLGKWYWEKDALWFRPRFPFRPGMSYVVEWRPDSSALVFLVPDRRAGPPARALHIFPSADTLPANLLKWYIEFSSPMGLGDVYEHIRLTDETGKTVEKPFLELTPPLWDQKQQRLTLWFDPGRIKTYLQPNETLGPPMSPGRRYTLRISKALRDAEGRPMAEDAEKTFVSAAPDREKPRVETWQICAPMAGSTAALRVRFPESMDEAMLKSGIHVETEGRQVFAGHIETRENETVWIFRPDQAWRPGLYRLVCLPRVEDLAGNNLFRLFDQAVENPAAPPAASPSAYEQSFWVAPN